MQQARFTEQTYNGQDMPYSGTMNDLTGGVYTVGTLTEFKQGKSMATGNKTDMEIVGEGFFVMQNMQTGENMLTRAGNFELLNDGRLVAYSGPTQFAVCNADMNPIVINPNERWDVRDDAAIVQAGGDVIPIAIVKPNDYFKMVKQGQNMFKSEEGFTPIEDTVRRIKPGHLEGSSVNPAAEMVELIETSRLIETNVKMINHQDEMTAGLISKVLRVA
jgi:flagellar basal-body rod protein FlgF